MAMIMTIAVNCCLNTRHFLQQDVNQEIAVGEKILRL